MKTLAIALPISFVAFAVLAPAYVLSAAAIAAYAAAFVLLISAFEYTAPLPRWQAQLLSAGAAAKSERLGLAA